MTKKKQTTVLIVTILAVLVVGGVVISLVNGGNSSNKKQTVATPSGENPSDESQTEPTASAEKAEDKDEIEVTAAVEKTEDEKQTEIITSHEGNPYLPLWEYIPDGEPYVFSDPENPEKKRVYIYGSHDLLKNNYCGRNQVVWSADVNDLKHWRYDGVIFTSPSSNPSEEPDVLFAPDVQEVIKDGKAKYYLYPNNQTWGRYTMVAESDSPIGPFQPINWANNSKKDTIGILGFDPAVYYDEETGKAYGYWGFCDSKWAELNPINFYNLKPGATVHNNIPSYDQCHDENFNPKDFNIVQDENVKKWGFFEASSLRKVGNKYVFIYSRNGLTTESTGKNYNQLAYGYSDSPAGPWTYGGIIVDAQGEVIKEADGKYSRSYPGGNTHGSICEINGNWYVFYHRNVETFARQAMADAITVSADETPVAQGGKVTISMAEVTSEGFCTEGLDPFKTHSAGIACYMVGGVMKPQYDQEATTMPITELKNNSVVGFKYFNFSNEKPSSITLDLIPRGVDGTIDIYVRGTEAVNTPVEKNASGEIISVGANSKKITSIELTKDMKQFVTSFEAEIPKEVELSGKQGIFFVFRSKTGRNICDFFNLKFN